MRVIYRSTLLEYDKVEVFDAEDANNQLYLGVLVDSEKNKDVYCVVQVTPEVLVEFENGRQELRSIFEKRTFNGWYLANIYGSIEDPIDLIRQANQDIAEKYLPENGFYLRKDMKEKMAVKEDQQNIKPKGFLGFIQSNLAPFAIGIITSLIVTVCFSYENPIRGFIDKWINKTYDGIEKVAFESDYNGTSYPTITISWGRTHNAKYYKIFRRQIGFDDCEVKQRVDNNYGYVQLMPPSQFEGVPKIPFIYTNSFIDSAKIGIYLYKIQAFDFGGTLLAEKEFCWYHRLKVVVVNSVNVRNYIDPSFKDDGVQKNEFQQNVESQSGSYGFTQLGPIQTNDGDRAWWNIEWQKNDKQGNPVIGWSVEKDDTKKYLEFESNTDSPVSIDYKK